MEKFKKAFQALWNNIKGATAIEYGMIMSAIAIAISAVVFSMGDDLNVIFQNIVDRITSVL